MLSLETGPERHFSEGTAYRDCVATDPLIFVVHKFDRRLPIGRPIHGVVEVDTFVPGCPPPTDTIFYILNELIAGRVPDPSSVTRFGAGIRRSSTTSSITPDQPKRGLRP